jgi:hypothetical protein
MELQHDNWVKFLNAISRKMTEVIFIGGRTGNILYFGILLSSYITRPERSLVFTGNFFPGVTIFIRGVPLALLGVVARCR